jgi:hypothetical protein
MLKSNKFCNTRWKRRLTIEKSKRRVIYNIAEEATAAYQSVCRPVKESEKVCWNAEEKAVYSGNMCLLL